jgi:hypothetical protein
VKNSFRNAEYRACILEEKNTSSKFCLIQSKKHAFHTVELRKAALSPYDDKRFLLNIQVLQKYLTKYCDLNVESLCPIRTKVAEYEQYILHHEIDFPMNLDNPSAPID